MSRNKRNSTIRALVLSSNGGALMLGAVERELRTYEDCSITGASNTRMLYEVFHLSRAVDSAITSVVQKFDPHTRPNGMGNGLSALVKLRPQYYDQQSRGRFVSDVSNKRNDYLHTADKYPANEREVRVFLSDCEACLTWVLHHAHHP